jgi:polyhydroxybutyrate depolymerase
VLFFREMVDYLKKYYPVDEKRIYASGFSNGGNFVSRLTLEAPDILAATAMMAGFLQDTSYKATTIISSYLAIGDLNVMSSVGNRPSWDESGIEVPQLRERVMVMVDKLQLDRTYKFQDGDSIITWQFDNNKGTASNMFRFSLIKDLEHRYPNGKNYPIVIAELFWDYFKKFQK